MFVDPASVGYLGARKNNKELDSLLDPRANKEFFQGSRSAKQRLFDPAHLSEKFTGKNINEKLKKASPKFGEIDEIGRLGEEKYGRVGDINRDLDTADSDYARSRRQAGESYLGSMGQATGTYKREIENLRDGAQRQAEDASQVYSGTLEPKLKGMLDADYKEAYGPGAMSLEQAGDPNNAIASKVRDLYNKEGQSQFDIFNQQAMNTQKEGLASSSVLGSLGAQNAASAFGAGGPMSVGQQQALYAASQGQAGQAFARAQQQMNNLRQQGLLQQMNMRSEGLGRGFEESDRQYGRTERAKGRAKESASQYSDEYGRHLGRQADLRAERGRAAADLMGIDLGTAQARRDFDDEMAGIGQSSAYKKGTRQLGSLNELYGNRMGVQQGKAAVRNANQAGNASMMGGLAGIAGTAVGGYFGGPAGASAGGAAGQQVGSASAGAPSAQYQQPTSYNQYGGNPYENAYNPYGARAYG